jgi:hypothetical protein
MAFVSIGVLPDSEWTEANYTSHSDASAISSTISFNMGWLLAERTICPNEDSTAGSSIAGRIADG